MKILMASLEHSLAPIDLRERLSFTKAQTADMDRIICSYEHIQGCVLISTCNRTELYLSAAEEVDPGQLLCRATHTEYEPYRNAFVCHSGDQAIRHLMAVAAGLRSRIWGEDQIISQVKGAISIARDAHTTDAVLETLFRSAISAGKEVRTKLHLTALPTSAASMAVELLQKKLGNLKGKKAVVIGNGEMGRLTAELLHNAGADVAVTLRTYRHGQTIVPAGCGVIAYGHRFHAMDGVDLVVSATTSPHFTVTADNLLSMAAPPSVLVDLAIPRDIQPEAGQLDGIELYNVHDLGDFLEDRTVPPEVTEIIHTHLDNFYRWVNYKDCMTTVNGLKEAITQRLLTSKELEADLSESQIIELAVAKTVDLMVSGLAERITADILSRCGSKIRLHTTGRQVIS